MNYGMKKATKKDISRLINYKLKTVFAYAGKLSNEEIDRIEKYVKEHVPLQLNNYKIIYINDNKIGCLLVEDREDGILLDEIYLEKEYRNLGIGTNIIKELMLENKIIYLWVYQENKKAVKLYMKLGFHIIEKTETRYYMKYKDEKVKK